MRQVTGGGSSAVVWLVAALVTGCGGGATPVTPTPGVLQVAGQYQIAQQGITDTCGQGTQIPSVTATVAHAAGAGTFSMADSGGTTFTGTVESSGDFTANAVFGPDAAGQTFTQRLQGRFVTTGFTAQLSVQVAPRTCAFTRAWTATKQGAPNVFP